MSAADDLRTVLLADLTVAALISTRAFSNTVPESYSTLPLLWYRQARVEYLELLGETSAAPYREFFDFECVSDDLAEAVALAAAVRAALDGQSGVLGAGTYQAVSVSDQWEDYQPRLIEADEHLQIVNLAVEVINQL